MTRSYALRSIEAGTAARAYFADDNGNPQEFTIGLPVSLLRTDEQLAVRRENFKEFMADCGAVWAGTMTNVEFKARSLVRQGKREAADARR